MRSTKQGIEAGRLAVQPWPAAHASCWRLSARWRPAAVRHPLPALYPPPAADTNPDADADANNAAAAATTDPATAEVTKLRLDWKTGVAATDWSAVAKKEHLDELTMQLRRLEDGIREVYSDMLLLQQREQEMRDVSGALRGCGSPRQQRATRWAPAWRLAPDASPSTLLG